MICKKCDMPLVTMPTDTRQLDQSAEILQLPASGETRLLDRVKLRFVVGSARLDVAIVDELLVGRSAPGVDSRPDVDLAPYVGPANELGVSRSHCLIKRQGYNLILRDLDSTNGTWQNGNRLASGEPTFLHDGDDLYLGHLKVAVFFVI